MKDWPAGPISDEYSRRYDQLGHVLKTALEDKGFSLSESGRGIRCLRFTTGVITEIYKIECDMYQDGVLLVLFIDMGARTFSQLLDKVSGLERFLSLLSTLGSAEVDTRPEDTTLVWQLECKYETIGETILALIKSMPAK